MITAFPPPRFKPAAAALFSHAPRQLEHIPQCLFLAGVRIHPGSAQRRSERGPVNGDDPAEAGLRIPDEHDLLMSAPLHLFQCDRHVDRRCARVNLAEQRRRANRRARSNGQNTVHHVVGRSVTGLPDAPGNAVFAPPAASPARSASRLG